MGTFHNKKVSMSDYTNRFITVGTIRIRVPFSESGSNYAEVHGEDTERHGEE